MLLYIRFIVISSALSRLAFCLFCAALARAAAGTGVGIGIGIAKVLVSSKAQQAGCLAAQTVQAGTTKSNYGEIHS